MSSESDSDYAFGRREGYDSGTLYHHSVTLVNFLENFSVDAFSASFQDPRDLVAREICTTEETYGRHLDYLVLVSLLLLLLLLLCFVVAVTDH